MFNAQNRIRQLMAERGWTIYRLAQESGLSQTTISNMLQCLPMEKFPRWRKALRANKPVVISDLQRLEKVYPDEAAFFREYGVTTLLAAPFSKRINQGFIAVDDPTRYTDDPVFLFIASYAVVVELNEIKQQQSLLAATKASKYNPEDIHINFFGGMEIISSKGTLTGEDIKAAECVKYECVYCMYRA